MLNSIVSLFVLFQVVATTSSFASMRPVLVCNDKIMSYRVTEVSGNLFGLSGTGAVQIRPHRPLKIDKPVHFAVHGNGISKAFSVVIFSRTNLAQFHPETQFILRANPEPFQEASFEAAINYFGVRSKAICRFVE